MSLVENLLKEKKEKSEKSSGKKIFINSELSDIFPQITDEILFNIIGTESKEDTFSGDDIIIPIIIKEGELQF